MENHNKSWYAVITSEILYNKNLTDKQKLLMAIISNLSNEKGFCFASNNYLGELLGCDKLTVSRCVSKLEELGLLNRVLVLYENGTVKYRALTAIQSPKTVADPLKKTADIYENHAHPIDSIVNTPIDGNINTPIDENVKGGIDVNVNYNNKVCKNKEKKYINEGIDITVNSFDERKQTFELSVKKIEIDGLTAEILENFIGYWTEPDKNGKKMRFEGEKFFDMKRRLATFIKNDRSSFKTTSKKPVKPFVDPRNVW